jgi:hypothetical protein
LSTARQLECAARSRESNAENSKAQIACLRVATQAFTSGLSSVLNVHGSIVSKKRSDFDANALALKTHRPSLRRSESRGMVGDRVTFGVPVLPVPRRGVRIPRIGKQTPPTTNSTSDTCWHLSDCSGHKQ